MYALFVELHARPDQVAILNQMLADVATAVTAEEGVVAYNIHHNSAQPNHFVLYELYSDETAFHIHLEDHRVKSLIASFDLLLVSEPRIVACNPISTFVLGIKSADTSTY